MQVMSSCAYLPTQEKTFVGCSCVRQQQWKQFLMEASVHPTFSNLEVVFMTGLGVVHTQKLEDYINTYISLLMLYNQRISTMLLLPF